MHNRWIIFKVHSPGILAHFLSFLPAFVVLVFLIVYDLFGIYPLEVEMMESRQVSGLYIRYFDSWENFVEIYRINRRWPGIFAENTFCDQDKMEGFGELCILSCENTCLQGNTLDMEVDKRYFLMGLKLADLAQAEYTSL